MEELPTLSVLPNMRKNISEVIKAFQAGQRRSGETCSTDGTTLYSYALPIARHTEGGIVIRNRYSTRTTQSQINACKAALPHTVVESL